MTTVATTHALLRGLAAAYSATTIKHEDTFPTSYEDGYLLFIALACLVVVLLAALAGFYLRKSSKMCFDECLHDAEATEDCPASCKNSLIYANERTDCCGFMNVFFLAALVGFSAAGLTWGIAVQPKYRGVKIAAAICGSLLLMSLMFCCTCTDEVPMYPVLVFILQILFTFILLVPGLVLLAMYCKDMVSVEEYEYFGPMRIMGYQTDYFEAEFCGANHCNGYHGKLKVAFGSAWGCPITEKWCNGFVLDSDCTINACQCEVSTESGSTRYSSKDCKSDILRNQAESCIWKKYDLYNWSERVSFDEEDYDRNQRPLEDPNWPFTSFYGDCLTCAATTSVPLESALKLKSIGRGLAIAGASGLVILPLLCLAMPQAKRIWLKLNAPFA